MEWNQDQTTKFDPNIITRFDIKHPGQTSFILGKMVTLSQWQVVATPQTTGLIYIGLYNSKEECVEEIDRLSNLTLAAVVVKALGNEETETESEE